MDIWEGNSHFVWKSFNRFEFEQLDPMSLAEIVEYHIGMRTFLGAQMDFWRVVRDRYDMVNLSKVDYYLLIDMGMDLSLMKRHHLINYRDGIHAIETDLVTAIELNDRMYLKVDRNHKGINYPKEHLRCIAELKLKEIQSSRAIYSC